MIPKYRNRSFSVIHWSRCTLCHIILYWFIASKLIGPVSWKDSWLLFLLGIICKSIAHWIYFELLGHAFGWIKIICLYTSFFDYFVFVYRYHSVHHQLNTSLFTSSFGCITWKTQLYLPFSDAFVLIWRVISMSTWTKYYILHNVPWGV